MFATNAKSSGKLSRRFGVGLASGWVRFGVGLGLVWGRFGVGLGSVWKWFGVGLESVRTWFGATLGRLAGPVLVCCACVVAEGSYLPPPLSKMLNSGVCRQ